MLLRLCGIMEKTQRNPPGHVMEFGTVIEICGRCSGAHDLIGICRISDVEKLTRQCAALAPPLVGILAPQILRRRRQRELDRARKVRFGRHDAALDAGAGRVVAQQPVQTAQSVTQILARTGADPIEQRPALGGFRLGGAACFDDRYVIFADVLCSAHRSAKIFGADTLVHACHMIGVGQYVGKGGEHRGFRLLPEAGHGPQ
jgi:hypothetical protein